MNSFRKLIICIAATFVIPVLVQEVHGQSNVRRYQPMVGKVHPEIELPDIDDRKLVALSDFRGKKVLLIHFASW